MRNALQILAVLAVLASPRFSAADPVKMVVSEMRSSSSDKGSFNLIGVNVLNVQALDVDISYDSTLLSNPAEVTEGGYVTNFNTSSPGRLQLSIFRPETHGILRIYLDFDKKSDSPGGIVGVSANSTRMAEYKPEHNETAMSDVPSSTDGNGDMDPATDGVIAPSAGTVNGESRSVMPAGKSRAVPGTSSETDNNRAGKTTEQPVRSNKDKVYTLDDRTKRLLTEETNVLERFRKFDGENGLRTFAALFDRSTDTGIAQEPPIALSDGETPVILTIRLREKPANSPGVALYDAKLVSFRREDDTTMVITVIPSRDSADAKLLLASGAEIMDFPLVVAPPVNIPGSTNENNFLAAFTRYLSDHAPAKRMGEDSYLYKYIFTANYLASFQRVAASDVSQ